MKRAMKAMVLTGHGGLDKYEWREDWPRPEPGPMEALIRVGACGLNNTDVNTRTGWYSRTVTEATTGDSHAEVDEADPTWGGRPIRFPRIQGADAVGEVVAVGAGADSALLGRRVMIDGWQRDWSDPENLDKARYFGSEIDGGFAEYTKCDARNVAVVDSGLTDAELADLLLLLHDGGGHAEPRERRRRRHRAGPRRLGGRGGRAGPACRAPPRGG